MSAEDSNPDQGPDQDLESTDHPGSGPPAAPTAEPRRILGRIVRLLASRLMALALLIGAALWVVLPRLKGPEPAPAGDTAPTARAPQAKAAPAAVPSETGSPPSHEDLSASLRRSELQTAFTASANARAAAKVKQRRLLDIADEAKGALDGALADLDRFASETRTLLEDDRGRSLAADPGLVERFRALVGTRKTPREAIQGLADSLEQLSAPVRKAHQDPEDLAAPDEQQLQLASSLRAEATKAREECRRMARILDGLVREGATKRPAAESLSGAIASGERAEELSEARAIARARDSARKEAEEAKARAEAEAVRLVGESEAAGILARARGKRAEADAALAAERAAAERESLRQKARAPEVFEYLGAFLAHGSKQPKEIQGAFLAFEATPEPGPVSYSRLRALGALEPGMEGLRRLAWAASDWQGDRPKWGVPGHPNEWSSGARSFVKKAQDLLRELGPTLVEQGRLAP